MKRPKRYNISKNIHPTGPKISKITKNPPADPFYQKIIEIYTSLYEDNFSRILLSSKLSFIGNLQKKVDEIIKLQFTKEQLKSQNLTFQYSKAKESILSRYKTDRTKLEEESKKFQKNPEKFSFLKHYRKHCIKTEDYAKHSCSYNKIGKFIEIKTKKNEKYITSYVICSECKICFLSSFIKALCTYCNKEYYTNVLNENEDENLLPSTWEKYHCTSLFNDIMKCTKCKNILYLNIKTEKLICKKCHFTSKPKEILWKCSICKADFRSKAKIYNPLEFQIYKKAIKLTLLMKKPARPNQILPCCQKNPDNLIFYHKDECNGELYEGYLINKKIIVCSKCHAMNFIEKFSWKCPLCSTKFHLHSLISSFPFKSKKFIVTRNISAYYRSVSVPKSTKRKIILDNKITEEKSEANFTKEKIEKSENLKIHNVCLSQGNIVTKYNMKKNSKVTRSYQTLSDILTERKKSEENLNKPKNTSNYHKKNRQKILSACASEKFFNENYYNTSNNKEIMEKFKYISPFRQDEDESKSFIKALKEAKTKTKETADFSSIKTNSNEQTKKMSFIRTSSAAGIGKNDNHIALNNIIIDTKINNKTKIINKSNIESSKKIIVNTSKILSEKNNNYLKQPEKKVSKKFDFSQSNDNIKNLKGSYLSSKLVIKKQNNFHRYTRIKSGVLNEFKNNDNDNTNNNHDQTDNDQSNNFICQSHRQIEPAEQLPESTISSIYSYIDNNDDIKTNKSNKKEKTNEKKFFNQNYYYSTKNINLKKNSLIEIKVNLRNDINSRQATTKGLYLEDSEDEEVEDTIEDIPVLNKAHQRRESVIFKNLPIKINKNFCASPETVEALSKESKIPLFSEQQYEYIKSIGEGTYGTVFLVENRETKEKFAIKKVICRDYTELQNQKRELELMYSVANESLLRIFGLEYRFLDITTYAINVLMENAECDWSMEIKKKNSKNNFYTENEIVNILKQVVKGLLYLQKKNIAHRDIKPQNILVFPNNIYKIADLGEAKTIINICDQSTLRGSQLYMSPALYQGYKYSKPNIMHNPFKSDMFSLGYCFFYAICLDLKILENIRELTTIKTVMNAVNKFHVKNRYSENLMKMLFKMIEPNENKRYDFEELNNDLNKNF